MSLQRFLCIFAFIVLASCTPAAVTSDTPAPTSGSAAATGTGLLRGRMLTSDGAVLALRTVRLDTVYGEGSELAYVADVSGGIGAVTDASGDFQIRDIPPGRYVLLLVLREGISLAVMLPSGTEKIIEITPDRLVDVGPLNIRLPE